MRRERDTWFAYAAQALFGFVLYGSGSITALVRAELGLGYLATGVLPALFTAGAVVGAAATGWLLRGGPGLGREVRVLGGAASAMGLGAAVMALPGLWPVAAGLGVAGVAGGMVPPAGAVLLASRHGDLAGRALLEVNVLAGLAGMLAAASLSAAASLAGWRLALVVPLLAGPVIGAVSLRLRSPRRTAAPVPDRGAGSRLPAAARWYVAVAVCAGVVEFSVLYWAADLIASATSMSATAAAGTLVAFTGGLVLGRAALSLLARSAAANRRILAGSLAGAAAGAVGLLAAGAPGPAVAALALVGLGTAALYPVTLALAVQTAGSARARASAVLSVAVGFAALLAPVLLAASADVLGLRAAFAAVPAVALAGLAAAWRGARATRSAQRAEAPGPGRSGAGATL